MSENELFLIAHKVRGQLAFDVAERHPDMGTTSDPAPWWIIPTSGHRAYPFWHVPIEIDGRSHPVPLLLIGGLSFGEICMPDSLPDHYQQERNSHVRQASRKQPSATLADVI